MRHYAKSRERQQKLNYHKSMFKNVRNELDKFSLKRRKKIFTLLKPLLLEQISVY